MQLTGTNSPRAWPTIYAGNQPYQRHLRCSVLRVHEKRERKLKPAPLAQLVEQLTLNQWVPGSSPWRCTMIPAGVLGYTSWEPIRLDILGRQSPPAARFRVAKCLGRRSSGEGTHLMCVDDNNVLYGPLVKWLRQRPLTPLTSVRIRYGSPFLCGLWKRAWQRKRKTL